MELLFLCFLSCTASDVLATMQGLHAIFTGEDDTWEAWLNADATGFSGAIGFGGNGIKLRRGYALPQSPKPTQAFICLLSKLLLLSVLFVLI